MRKEKLKTLSLRELAKEWGVNCEVLKIKSELIKLIQAYCEKEKISQRGLAERVEGLSQDRVSKIFSGQIGHMTIDKLVHILDVLKIRVKLKKGG